MSNKLKAWINYDCELITKFVRLLSNQHEKNNIFTKIISKSRKSLRTVVVVEMV